MTPDEPVFTFGPFQLLVAAKVLLEADTPVRIGGRAMQILIELVKQPGRTVTKRDLMARVWPGSLIEESNLRIHITTLRRALGDGRHGARYIVNDSGRGYRFVSPIGRSGLPAPSHAAHMLRPLPGSSLIPPSRLVGREEVLGAILGLVARSRLVTIAGPCGVGKSAVALAVAQRFLETGLESVAVVDLAAIDDPRLVPAALATSVGISAVTDDPVSSLVAFLACSRRLIVLDNCEHVIGQVAVLTEEILKRTAQVHILATSREPLLAQGELLHHLSPLSVPQESVLASVAGAMSCSAVRLFVERANHSGDSFELSESNVDTVIRICRSLDGLPLALELVAAQLPLFGLDGLAARLTHHLLRMTTGRRPTRPRHESIRAALDWGYGTLSPEEQRLLRALAVFKSAFPIESASAVAFGQMTARSQVLEPLLSLAEKSFITTDVSGAEVLYRLLHVTRAYAMERLVETGEHGPVLRRHAERCCAVLERAQVEWEFLTREEWLSRYQYLMDDVRAALDWTFSTQGDLDLAVALTWLSLPFGFQLCQIAEFKRRAELALERLSGASPPQWVAELRLNIALGALYKNTEDSEDEFLRAYGRAEQLAERLGIAKYKVETLVARTVSNLEQGNTPAALEASDELLQIAAQTACPIAQLIADRAAAQARHFAGQHSNAREFAARVLTHPARSIPLAYTQAAVDRRVWMRIVQSRSLWLEGYTDQAETLATECLHFAASDGPFAKCHALALAAIPIAFWRGDTAAARELSEDLIEHCRRYTLSRWLKLGLCYRLVDSSLGGDRTSRVSGASNEQFAWPANPLHYDLLATVCEDWVDAATIRRAEQGLSGWSAPEVLRVAGELALRSGAANANTTAEVYFLHSLRIAAGQHALAWELRTTQSLARLRQSEGRRAEARRMLTTVTSRFSEGFDAADFRAAHHLLCCL
jgi:predicted ATPase/DNA-binding winged helix-turn-helix (wHTH) protein/transcriptional regulator with XRE-family HTH domain